jgi:hypothetical protein
MVLNNQENNKDKEHNLEARLSCDFATSPANTRFLGLKEHPEPHADRYPGVKNSLDVF